MVYLQKVSLASATRGHCVGSVEGGHYGKKERKKVKMKKLDQCNTLS